MEENPSTEKGHSRSGKYNIIPVVTTTKINPGDSVVVDYYVTGRHPHDNPPEYVRMNVNMNGIDVDSGTVAQYVDQQWGDGGKSLQFISGELVDKHELEGHKAFSLDIPEALFFPNPDMVDEETPYSSPPLHGELETNEEGLPPFRLQIDTSTDQEPGDYTIASTLIYEQDEQAETDRVVSQVHVNTWYQRNQFLINAIVITLALAGVLFPIIEHFLLP